VIAIGALAVAGCSTKSSAGDSATSSGPMVSSSPGVSGQGVTARTIKVGITYPDLAAIRNIVNIDHGDYKAAYTAVIDEVNKQGGIDGRTLVPVFAPVNPIGTAPADTACTKLTEDEKVFAVLGSATNPGCYITTHAVALVGTSVSPSQAQGAKAPWFSTALTDDHNLVKVLDALDKKGAFKGHKVAVVGQSGDESAVRSVAIPELKKLGANVVQTAINSAPTNDVNAEYQQYGLIARKFQSFGADVVVAVGQAGTGWPKALQVNRSSYLPRLVAGSFNSLSAYVADNSGNDPEVLQGAVTGSSNPSHSVGWTDPAMKSCVALVRQAEPNADINDPITATAKTPNTWVSPTAACQNVALFVAIAKAAGTTLNDATFNQGGESLTGVLIPGFAGVALHYGPDKHDGDGAIYLSNYDTAQRNLVTDQSPS
jgi:ABC-type branched-subunit amino acid transport system substrate-binding protein